MKGGGDEGSATKTSQPYLRWYLSRLFRTCREHMAPYATVVAGRLIALRREARGSLGHLACY